VAFHTHSGSTTTSSHFPAYDGNVHVIAMVAKMKTVSEGVAHLWFSEFASYGALEFDRENENRGTAWLDELVSISLRAAESHAMQGSVDE
jgi:hypothetical protein